MDIITDINWPGVVVATIAYYALGGLWFTPLFGAAWDRAVGFDRPKGNRFPPMYYIVPLASSFAVAVATAVLLRELAVERVAEAIGFGAIVGVGYAAAVSFNNAVTPNTPRPLLLGAVTGGYHVVGIALTALILATVGS